MVRVGCDKCSNTRVGKIGLLCRIIGFPINEKDNYPNITCKFYKEIMPVIKKNERRPWEPKPQGPQTGRANPNSKFYQSTKWRKLRKSYIAANPLCVFCLERGEHVAANIVDHITPINQGGAPLSESNLQSLCHKCHNKKSGREAHGRR